jgi:hypothetical protein
MKSELCRTAAGRAPRQRTRPGHCGAGGPLSRLGAEADRARGPAPRGAAVRAPAARLDLRPHGCLRARARRSVGNGVTPHIACRGGSADQLGGPGREASLIASRRPRSTAAAGCGPRSATGRRPRRRDIPCPRARRGPRASGGVAVTVSRTLRSCNSAVVVSRRSPKGWFRSAAAVRTKGGDFAQLPAEKGACALREETPPCAWKSVLAWCVSAVRLHPSATLSAHCARIRRLPEPSASIPGAAGSRSRVK